MGELGMQLAPEVLQLLLSGVQFGMANHYAHNNARPQYSKPHAIDDMYQSALTRAGSAMFPGQDIATAELERTGANTMSRSMGAVGSSSDLMALATGIGANESAGKRALALEGLRNQNVNQDKLQAVRSTVAGYQDKEFDLNKFQPYMQRSAAISSFLGSGIQNAYNSFKGASGVMQTNELLNRMYPQNGGTPTTDTTSPDVSASDRMSYVKTFGVDLPQPLVPITGAPWNQQPIDNPPTPWIPSYLTQEPTN